MKIYLIQKSVTSSWIWNIIFNEIASYCENNFQAEIIYEKNCDRFYIKEFDYTIKDCEMIIYDEVEDVVKAISFSESNPEIYNLLFRKRNNKKDILLITQSSTWFKEGNIFSHWDGSFCNDCQFKVEQTLYFSNSSYINYDSWYTMRNFIKNKINLIEDKMFFLCTTGRPDEKKLRIKNLITEANKLPYTDYLDLAITYKIGLSLSAGNYEVCPRDIEYMAIGLPMLRLEYINPLYPKLIPNFHYISIDREDFFPKDPWIDHEGGENYIDAYLNKFNEVKNDIEFLNFISKNAREYYVENCSPQNRTQKILNQLGF